MIAAETASGRRQRLLAWLLISILLLTIGALFLVLAVDPAGSPQRSEYIPFILVLGAIIVLAYAINSAGYYFMAAGLTVVTAVLGVWGSPIIDPAILHGDIVPLAYALVPVLLCSLLLPPLTTAILAGVQLVGLASIVVAHPAMASANWPSLLGLIFFTSVLSVLSGYIGNANLAQIDRQRRELAESAEGLRELSVRDYLTKLFNRRYLEETLAREIRRSVRSHHAIGVIMFDVDQFKQVNDRWGHAAGDTLLQQIGQLAITHIRGGDIACRYGGDEFVLVLPEASRQATRQRADSLRHALKHLDLEYNGHSLGTITMSMGVAMYPEHGASGEALLKSADKALYRAKEAGRDRVKMAEKRS